MKMICNYYANKTHFHNKGFALSLVLKVRFLGTRKWPICINLIFECVKIVEFNFNSHVFLVMYQEICFPKQDACFFLNQDVCFLNQEERRQFLISSVSERD